MVLDEHLQGLYGKGNLVADLRIAVLYYRSVKIYCYCHLVPKQIVSPCKGSGNFLLFIHLCSKGVVGRLSLPCRRLHLHFSLPLACLCANLFVTLPAVMPPFAQSMPRH